MKTPWGKPHAPSGEPSEPTTDGGQLTAEIGNIFTMSTPSDLKKDNEYEYCIV